MHYQQPMDAIVEYSIKTSPWKMETTTMHNTTNILTADDS
jgi:hypothetical protein